MSNISFCVSMFQHTAARRRLEPNQAEPTLVNTVSTHSRPKAAGPSLINHIYCVFSFNTQPPEGGWPSLINHIYCVFSFNTQPPEGGWAHHSYIRRALVSFNTQPPEGGWQL